MCALAFGCNSDGNYCISFGIVADRPAATAKHKTGNIQPLVALAVTTVVAVFLVTINYADR